MPHARPLWPARLALALLMLVLCGASLLLWQQLQRVQQERVGERVGYQARTLVRQLETSLNDQVDGLRRLAQLWGHRNRLPQDEWALDARYSLEHFPGYQAIQWLDADLQMRWLLPLEGNEAALRFRLSPAHPNYPLAMQAKSSGQPRFSNSFDLVQGGRGFVLYMPLFIRDDQAQLRFDGFLQGVFRVEGLMDALLETLSSDDFSVRLLENEQPLYSHEQADTLVELQQQMPLHLLNNQHFALQLSPTRKLVDTLGSPLPQFVLGASLTISLLLVAALALALENTRRANALQISNSRLNDEMQRREDVEQSLRESRERLQLVLDLTDWSRDGLFILDPRSREILHMNQATYRSLGFSAEEFVERMRTDPEQLLPGFHAWLELVRQAHRHDLSKIFQREMRRADGSSQAAEISAQLVTLNDHEYLIGVSRDNSERLLLEAQLQRLSQQDGLTGLFNRRHFDRQLHAEWRRLRRMGAPLALLMLDVDHFKAYNDQLGHLAGDDALRRVSAVLQGCLQREGDVACRYGGEEFAIILLNTRAEGASHVAARIHQLVAELELPHPGSPLGRLTLSIGIATSDPNQDSHPDALVAHSDQALYRAKREGRDRTCEWAPLDDYQALALPPYRAETAADPDDGD
ncbi:MAG: diguanylate cyclase [Pseudomonas sp.]|uniref:sensor domain-containing diguanylate cyclase n=1 Tax=Pseudomonas sp. TaxID=306 RepID=UPI0033924F06